MMILLQFQLTEEAKKIGTLTFTWQWRNFYIMQPVFPFVQAETKYLPWFSNLDNHKLLATELLPTHSSFLITGLTHTKPKGSTMIWFNQMSPPQSHYCWDRISVQVIEMKLINGTKHDFNNFIIFIFQSKHILSPLVSHTGWIYHHSNSNITSNLLLTAFLCFLIVLNQIFLLPSLD